MRDRLELECTFIPDAQEGHQTASPIVGAGQTLRFRCIAVPDGSGDQRPSYPWIELGSIATDEG